MSAPLAGKFQDHYEVLGIDPKADTAAVERAYAERSKQHAGEAEKLAALELAREVLTDPDLRRSFNALKGLEEQESVEFSGPGFFEALSREAGLRTALLCVLYDRRKTKMFKPSLSTRQLEGLLETTSEELAFALWYLKQRSLVANDDKSSLQITVAGIDLVDRERPLPESVQPYIKGWAPALPVAPASAGTAASIVSMLRRNGQEPARV